MDHQFIVYLKNKTSLKFEYKSDVSRVVRTDNGYNITFNSGTSGWSGIPWHFRTYRLTPA